MVPHSIHAPSYERECRSRFYTETQKAFLPASDPKAVDQKAIPMLLFRVAVVNVPLDRERPVQPNPLHLPGSTHRRSPVPRFLFALPPPQAKLSRVDRPQCLSLAPSR